MEQKSVAVSIRGPFTVIYFFVLFFSIALQLTSRHVRYIEPPVALEDLHIDVVLLSHTHYDHLDYSTAKRIGNRALWCAFLNLKSTKQIWD